MGGCLGSGREEFEFILHGLQGLGCSPEGLTGRGGIGIGEEGRACVGARGPFCVFVFVQGEASL